MRIFAIALCVVPALAGAQDDETNGLANLLRQADEVQSDMENEAHAKGVTKEECLEAADPELGEIMFPEDPDAYQALVEETCAAFD